MPYLRVLAGVCVAGVAVSAVSAAFAPEPMFTRAARPAPIREIPGVEIDGRWVPDPDAVLAALRELGAREPEPMTHADVPTVRPRTVRPLTAFEPLEPAPDASATRTSSSRRTSVTLHLDGKGGRAVVVRIEESREESAEPASPTIAPEPDTQAPATPTPPVCQPPHSLGGV